MHKNVTFPPSLLLAALTRVCVWLTPSPAPGHAWWFCRADVKPCLSAQWDQAGREKGSFASEPISG